MKKIKTLTTILFTLFSVLIFSTNSGVVGQSVKTSLVLCFNCVLPALLPFFILCEFLIKMSICISIPTNLTAFISGLITGFPTGIKNVCTLYKSNSLDRKTATSLLHCCANASPAYLITFIGTYIIKNRGAGIVLFISQLTASFLCFIIFGGFYKSKANKSETVSITESLCFAVTDSVKACLNVCGYIIFFGIFADLLQNSGLLKGVSSEIQAIVIGAIEITRGLSLIDFQKTNAIYVAAVIAGFSGISVIMQCVNCVINAGLSSKAILTGKLLYMLIMPCICFIIINFQIGLSIPIIVFGLALTYNIFDKWHKRLYNK